MHIELIEIGNFRKLKAVRIELCKEKTIFVGANNSGKTSAMIALRYFLLEDERKNFSLNDFTLSHWPTINAMGQDWEKPKAAEEPDVTPDWSPILPFVDVWLSVDKTEAHHVQRLIPTLDWDGGRLGVRIRFEPRDPTDLQKQYLAAREDAKTIEAVDSESQKGKQDAKTIALWPKSLTEFLQRRLGRQFQVRGYILDPSKLQAPEHEIARPQALNHRCPRRVIELINKIRSDIDKHMQVPRSDAPQGFARLYIRSTKSDRAATEETVRNAMAAVTGDDKWNSRDDCKMLTLEHHMAATRLGFNEMLEPLQEVKRWRTSLLEGKLAATRFFSNLVLPLVDAAQRDDKFAIAAIVRRHSPLITVEQLKAAPDAGALLRKAQEAVAGLIALWKDSEPTCGQVLDKIVSSGLFDIPDVLQPVATLRSLEAKEAVPEDDPDDPISTQDAALGKFLSAPFNQIRIFTKYAAGEAAFDTHQGVKGLEFDRVMVIIDDAESRGFMFGYEKYFGAEGLSATDRQRVSEGKETGLDRTRRLLYVTCSRAKKSLALVIYTENPAAVRAHVLKQGLFAEEEIDGP